MQSIPALCYSCRFLMGNGTCRAFPKGIPEEIFIWGEPHTEATPDQKNDITWELKPGAEQEFQDWKEFITAEVR